MIILYYISRPLVWCESAQTLPSSKVMVSMLPDKLLRYLSKFKNSNKGIINTVYGTVIYLKLIDRK